MDATFFALGLFVLLGTTRSSTAVCSTAYGATKPCIFTPAPPGHTPPCAQPGMTYCEQVPTYPSKLIHELVSSWRFDHGTFFVNESPDDLNTYFVPSSRDRRPYGQGNFITEEPIYIPKPPSGYQDRLPSQVTRQNFTGYPDRRPTSFYTRNGYGANDAGYRKGDAAQQLVQYSYQLVGRPAATDYTPFHRFDASSSSSKRYKREVLPSSETEEQNVTSSARQRSKRQDLGSAVQLCPTRSHYVMPKAALNTKGNWMYVVNIPEVDRRYTQFVKSETCTTQVCSGLCGLPNGYQSRCEQKYVQKRLVALEGTGSQLYTDMFWFPSCCTCSLTRS